MAYLLEIQIFAHVQGAKEVVLVDYLFQRHISVSVLETDASVYMCTDVKSCHYEPGTTSGFLASGGEECNPGPETRLDHAEPSCDQVLLKYKRDRESI